MAAICCPVPVGAGTTVCTALAVALAASSFGAFIGLICGYHKGKATTLLLRLTDVFLAFPSMVFAIAVAGILGGGTFNAAAAIAAVACPKYTRLVRNQVLPLHHEYYIEAARMSGFSYKNSACADSSGNRRAHIDYGCPGYRYDHHGNRRSFFSGTRRCPAGCRMGIHDERCTQPASDCPLDYFCSRCCYIHHRGHIPAFCR